MKQHLLTIVSCLCSTLLFAQQKVPVIELTGDGVMRWSDTKKEAPFFGVNYTLPFAHAYRAMGYLGVDRKSAVDRDVYHFARLGINAYRIHIWDVEISDANGNLIENEHLDLLDYLIAKLEQRNIRTILTAETNFGNGYPERNQQTGGFSYNYDKGSMHSNPKAVAAQERYLKALVRHINPYTGQAYKDDPFVVGFEINNEPSHPGTAAETKNYLDRMLAALQQAGNRKPVFYNVSQNTQQAETFYSSPVQGTTFQWYPTGLVAGHTRQGNFLPYVDRYSIPFSSTKGFDQKARLIYEFDAPDVMYSFMYPAMVRSFRTAGFQWMTQFAYDPIDMAWANTEYQTHYLNLAYTPNKAISLKIAGEAARTLPRNVSYGVYPADTLFGHVHISYEKDLSEWNTAEQFYYSNKTTTVPKDTRRLTSVAGCGSSPVVAYEGTGAYFLDKLENGLWRLEVMPDAIQVKDPFAKPSLKKHVVKIYWGQWDMFLHLPDLGDRFSVTGINDGNQCRTEAAGGKITAIKPGVYLLQKQGKKPEKSWGSSTKWGTICLGEFVAPAGATQADGYDIVHKPYKTVDAGKPVVIEAVVAGASRPDSVLIYTDQINFWSDQNPSVKMTPGEGYTYRGVLPGTTVTGSRIRYNLVTFKDGKTQTFPSGVTGSPLDWDYTETTCWESEVVDPQSPVRLVTVTDENSGLDAYTLSGYIPVRRQLVNPSPEQRDRLRFTFESDSAKPVFFVRKYIRDEV
ncbi:MAG: cellulase family glycosylhydrolase, partial [Bacteroidota bacterium]|nr:cellulase family glycosylhydrolase [Bacteroidota bacterium]